MRHGKPRPLSDEPVYRFWKLIGSECKELWSRWVRGMDDLASHTIVALFKKKLRSWEQTFPIMLTANPELP